MTGKKGLNLSQERLLRVISGEDRDASARALRLAANVGTPAFRAITGTRNTLYACHLMPARKLGRPTISIGNLTVGGTGKTPMVIELAQRLLALGERPAVLLRGYEPRGLESKTGSDEAAVLRGALGNDVPVQPDAKRWRGAAKVLAEHPGTTVFLLDDGFQHRQAHRDLDLVLLDATRPFGYGRVLPRGLLREPLGSLKRADAVILTRVDRVDADTLETLAKKVQQITGHPPLARCAHRWTHLREGANTHDLAKLRSLKVFGVSGLGNPGDFEAKLREAAGQVVGCIAFPDHHPYTRTDISGVMHTAVERGAQAVVTTEKDWVKWRKLAGGVKLILPVYRPVVQMRFVEGEAEVDRLLRDALQRST